VLASRGQVARGLHSCGGTRGARPDVGVEEDVRGRAHYSQLAVRAFEVERLGVAREVLVGAVALGEHGSLSVYTHEPAVEPHVVSRACFAAVAGDPKRLS
jgi:hypothetical protein